MPEGSRIDQILALEGYPHRTANGQLSVKAIGLPTIQSPCLHQFPVISHTPVPTSENQSLDRHVEMFMQPQIIETIKARAEISALMRKFLNHEDFYEVATPILAASAGGATARPFETSASEFPDKKLALRIAPELWLKRLIIGGMQRIFEMGPSFRNEGQLKTLS